MGKSVKDVLYKAPYSHFNTGRGRLRRHWRGEEPALCGVVSVRALYGLLCVCVVYVLTHTRVNACGCRVGVDVRCVVHPYSQDAAGFGAATGENCVLSSERLDPNHL